ncbi:uncharacterized protein LOC114537858 [Dendronephthya gigantea]|uniref:uncharacterized protein LOC114537858 n=1 Tax=Dendronephthya gigantea TaxID=151771 RepID=UPI00106A232D|nr:uncharacterized protein LOC114537858 [Dendronephthya gigantea]
MDEKALTKLIGNILDKKLNPVMKTLDDLRHKINKIDKIEESIDFLSSKYDELITKYDSANDLMKDVQEENQCLRKQLHEAVNNIEMLKAEVNDLEQYSRRDCLEIRGIPMVMGENTNEIVKRIGQEVGVHVSDQDISISHRLRASDGRDPAIIVKFNRRDVRDKLYRERKVLRDKSIKDIGITRFTDRKIYIVESLTNQNRKLFNKCLEVRREKNFKYIWTSSGKILLRKNESSPTIPVVNWRDLTKIMNS